MKLSYIILPIILLLISCSEKSDDKTEISPEQKLIAKLSQEASKIVTQNVYKIKFGEPEDAPYEVIKTYFNKSNKSIASTFYENGTIIRLIINERNDDNIIKSTEYNSEGIIDSKKIYEYDNYLNKITETDYNSKGSIISKWIYKYDSLNNVTEEFYYDSTDLRSITESKYDAKGRKIEEIERENYNLSQSSVFVNPKIIIDKGRTESEFRYNKNNKLISEYSKRFERYNGSWKLYRDMLIQYSYDKDGRLIQKTTKSPYTRNNNQPFYDRREESKYDDNGNLIECLRYTITKEDGETLENKWDKKYNSNGDIIEHRYYNNLGETTSFTNYDYNYINR